MGYIDLHVHSTASDGSLSPAQLVQYACEKGLYAFALTDHDSVAGISAARKAAENYPVKVIPGVEISSALGSKSIHILGYYIDYEDSRFLRSLHQISRSRDERNIKICAQLRSYGIDIDYESFRAQTGCRMITRNHFAFYLIAQGYVSSRMEAFEKYLAKGRPCYIPLQYPATSDVVRLIRNAGGTAVLAHPIQYRMTDKGYIQLFTLVKTFGVKGVEAIYSDHTPEEEQKFRSIAASLGMFVTGGSDFHGALKPEIDLGTGRGNIMIPQSLLDNLRRANTPQ